MPSYSSDTEFAAGAADSVRADNVIRHPTSRSRSHQRRRSSQRLWLGIGMSVSLLLLFFSSVYYFTEISRLTVINDQLRGALEKSEHELGQVRPELERTRTDLEALVQGRYPNLIRLEPDKVLTIGQGYLKNIVFTVVQQGRSDKKFEYKLVMDNQAGYEIRPEFKMVVFDKLGVQIGSDEVSLARGLLPGESRSHSSAVTLFMEGEPHWFYITAKGNGSRKFASEDADPPAKKQ